MTAGPTRESIDPVRVVTNRSSGKMGYRLAEAAWERGADVVLISGPVALPPPIGVDGAAGRDHARPARRRCARSCPAPTCWSWRRRRPTSGPAARATASGPAIDGALAIAARADRRHPRAPPASSGSRAASSSGSRSRPATRWRKGRAKLERKELDLIVVNDALEPGAGFEHDTNRVAHPRPGRHAADPAAAVQARGGRGHPRRGGARLG